jgi:hypothetical protein
LETLESLICNKNSLIKDEETQSLVKLIKEFKRRKLTIIELDNELNESLSKIEHLLKNFD